MKPSSKAAAAKSGGRGRQAGKTDRKSAPGKMTGRATARAVRAKPPAPEPSPPATSARPSKKAAITLLLQRPEGAAIGDLSEATGWQVHSVRAALTGLRKEGKDLVRAKDAAGVTRYRLEAQA
jgi:hypothetical protein